MTSSDSIRDLLQRKKQGLLPPKRDYAYDAIEELVDEFWNEKALPQARIQLEMLKDRGEIIPEDEIEASIITLAESICMDEPMPPPHWRCVGECESCGYVTLPHPAPKKTKTCPWCWSKGMSRAREIREEMKCEIHAPENLK